MPRVPPSEYARTREEASVSGLRVHVGGCIRRHAIERPAGHFNGSERPRGEDGQGRRRERGAASGRAVSGASRLNHPVIPCNLCLTSAFFSALGGNGGSWMISKSVAPWDEVGELNTHCRIRLSTSYLSSNYLPYSSYQSQESLAVCTLLGRRRVDL